MSTARRALFTQWWSSCFFVRHVPSRVGVNGVRLLRLVVLQSVTLDTTSRGTLIAYLVGCPVMCFQSLRFLWRSSRSLRGVFVVPVALAGVPRLPHIHLLTNPGIPVKRLFSAVANANSLFCASSSCPCLPPSPPVLICSLRGSLLPSWNPPLSGRPLSTPEGVLCRAPLHDGLLHLLHTGHLHHLRAKTRSCKCRCRPSPCIAPPPPRRFQLRLVPPLLPP